MSTGISHRLFEEFQVVEQEIDVLCCHAAAEEPDFDGDGSAQWPPVQLVLRLSEAKKATPPHFQFRDFRTHPAPATCSSPDRQSATAFPFLGSANIDAQVVGDFLPGIKPWRFSRCGEHRILLLHFCSTSGAGGANRWKQDVLVSHSRDAVNAMLLY